MVVREITVIARWACQTTDRALGPIISAIMTKYLGTAGEFGVTNNRMEIMALIQSIKRLNDLKSINKIHICLDSQYVLNLVKTG